MQFGWKGTIARPESRVLFKEGGAHRGFLKTADLVVEYEYTRNPDNMLLSGYVQLDDSLRYNYELVDFFFLTINFLKGDGTVIERQTAMIFMSTEPIESKWRFERTFEIPPQTAAFAFSYKGRVLEKGQDNGGDWNFYLNPLQKPGK